MTHASTRRRRVVVLGAGFGGLAATKRLAEDESLEIIVVDQRNYHLFQPLLYQVATAALNASQIATPIRAMFARQPNVEVHLGRVDRIDADGQFVEVAGERLTYDYLIAACGAHHSYFGHEEWEPVAPGLKTVEQAIEIRRRLLLAFELAENERDPGRQKAFLTFIVVGGGPSGVELAGAIADIARTVLVADFRRIRPSDARVVLAQSGDRVLPSFSKPLSARCERDLLRLGVEVRKNARVSAIDEEAIHIGDERIETFNVFWAAGVEADALTRTIGVPIDRSGRVRVHGDLSVPGHDNLFVIGDAAYLEVDGRPVPGLAPAAMQEGRTAAENVIASIAGRPRANFRYRDKGMMATIGKRRAVLLMGRLELGGLLAWVAWMVVHVLLLAGHRNRASVFFDWAWSYALSARGARLITGRDWQNLPPLTPRSVGGGVAARACGAT